MHEVVKCGCVAHLPRQLTQKSTVDGEVVAFRPAAWNDHGETGSLGFQNMGFKNFQAGRMSNPNCAYLKIFQGRSNRPFEN